MSLRLRLPVVAVPLALVSALALTSLSGCDVLLDILLYDGGLDADGGPGGECGLRGQACLTGNVVDVNGQAVPSVTVSAAGAKLGTSNEQGWFFLSGAPSGDRVSVCFSAAGFVTRCRNVSVAGGQSLSMTPTALMKEGTSGSVAAAVGGAVSDSATGAKFVLPANAGCRVSSGAAASGALTCVLTPLDVTSTSQRALAPGDWSATTAAGQPTQLVSSGLMDITCKDAAGERLTLCAGATADVQIPITGTCANDAVNPPSISSWGFDEASGLWQEYGTFTRVCGAPSYYAGKIGHLSYWNADRAYDITCLTGKVVGRDAAPVWGANVRCEGVDYQGASEAFSGSDGRFCAKVKPGGSYSCVVAKGTFKTEPLTGVASSAAAQCGGAGCSDLGTVTLAEPLFRTMLTWGETPHDLDSHFVGGNGVHVMYSSRGSLSSAPFVDLDTDDTTSYGPEVTTVMATVEPGTYRFCVHNYSGETSGAIASSGAAVNLFSGSTHSTWSVPGNPNGGDVWRVYEVVIDANHVATFRPLNTMGTSSGSDVGTACLQ